jgi:hypothetical protein
MSRSGYCDSDGGDEFDSLRCYGWQANVQRCIGGKQGQRFMWELYLALEALPKRELITKALIDQSGGVCSLGSVAILRGMQIPIEWTATVDSEPDDYEFAEAMGPLFGLKDMLAREVMYQNDDAGESHYIDNGLAYGRLSEIYNPCRETRLETPAERWQRVRNWVVSNLGGIP